MAVVAVGNNPKTFATLRRADVGTSKHIPRRIVPECGKVLQDGDKSASAKVRAVFDEAPRRFDFVDDAREFAPETGLCAGKPCSFSG